MNWYPQALLTAEQAAAGVFLFFEKRHAFFQKGMFLTKTIFFSNL